MSDLKIIVEKLQEFRDKRDWKKYHKPKDMALSLILEISELLEHFQWKSDEEIKDHIKNHKKEVGEELADVLNWVLLMAHDFNIDIFKASLKKIDQNNRKYPIRKTKGKYTKYNKL